MDLPTKFVIAVCAGISALFMTGLSGAKPAAVPAPVSDAASTSVPAPADTVWVQRPDGGQQCEPDTAQALEAGANELQKAKIEVINSRKGDDGKMRIQMCGAPTGQQNAYLIRRADLPKALTLGFHEVKTKP